MAAEALEEKSMMMPVGYGWSGKRNERRQQFRMNDSLEDEEVNAVEQML